MLSLKARKRWSLVILLVGLPLYLVVAVSAVNLLDARFGRQPIWIEVAIYLVLGFLWAIPFRFVFKGIGRPEDEDDNV